MIRLRLPQLRRSGTRTQSVPTDIADILAPLERSTYDGPIIDVRDVTRIYRFHGNDVPALTGITLSVEAGQMVALRGRSGSGKTTLLNIIGGLDRPTAGSVRIEGQTISSLTDREATLLRRSKMSFVFQSYALFPVLSARENVDLAMRIAGLPAAVRDRRSRDLLELIGLGHRLDHRPFELSGGQQQRVAIARALANNPLIILADEPTGELDSVTGLQILRLFRKIVVDHGVTVIVATHDPTINEIAHITYEIQDGRLVQLV
ncbi:MAG: ABC transporter ATP-binding protein [Chloroflexi bacterium]|nr:ABC transporter ATP-binding protein [Chloroflexota bacterium]